MGSPPRPIDYDVLLLRLLHTLPGGQGEVNDVCDRFYREYLPLIPEEHLLQRDTGEDVWRNNVRWARQHLRQRGFLEAPARGIWKITEAGRRWVEENPGAERMRDVPERTGDQPGSHEQPQAESVAVDHTPAPRIPGGAERVGQRDEFLERAAAHLRACLSPEIGYSAIRHYPRRNWLQVLFPGFGSCHYELWLARGFNEVGLHLEGRREENLARLAALAPHTEEFSAALGMPVAALPWGENWARLAVEIAPAPWTDETAREYASLLARFVEVTLPAVKEAVAGSAPVDLPDSHARTRPDRPMQRDKFLQHVAEELRERLPPQTGRSEVRFYPGRNWLIVLYSGFPSSEYGLRLARGFDEVAFWLQGRREDNLARLAILAPHKDELAAVLGHPVVAVPWGSNWARLSIERAPAAWTEEKAGEYATLMVRFVEVTLPLVREAFAARPSHAKTRVSSRPVAVELPDGRAHAILDQLLMQIRTFLQGRSSRPSDHVLCDWVQLCYQFELYAEGAELFQMVVPAEVNEWLYGRTSRLAQVCRMRAPNKG